MTPPQAHLACCSCHALCAPADAKFCENAFTQIVKKVPSVASVRTEYIATYSEADKKASCMHGDKECEGNKQQLCLQAYVPADKNQDWFLKTLMCHMGGDVAESKQLKSCMVTSGIPEAVQVRDRLWHIQLCKSA